MSLMTRLLTLALIFLLLCSFTTSLLKTEPPSFSKAMDMFSEITIDVDDLFSRFVFEPPSEDTFVIPEDAGVIEEFLWEAINLIIGWFYEIIVAVTVVYSAVMLLFEVGEAVISIVEVVIYLMFGINPESLRWDVEVEKAPVPTA